MTKSIRQRGYHKKRFSVRRFFSLNVPLVLFMIFILIPLVWALLTSLKSYDQVSGENVSVFPNPLTLINYVNVWKASKFQVYFGNSLFIASISVIFIVLLSICNGYVLSRYDFHGKKAVMVILLCTQLMPVVLFIIPLFVVFKTMGLINTRLSVILFYIVQNLAFNSIMMKSFVDGVPYEIEEAAHVDGCSRMRTLVHIVMPLLVPGIVACLVMAFVNCWNDFLVAFSFIQKQSSFTIPIALKYMIGEYNVDYGQLAAGSIIALIIPVVLFAYIQKYLVSGLSNGAVKG